MNSLVETIRVARAFFFFPVFFTPSLLDEFKKKPFKIEMLTQYLGDIRRGNEWIITFGISPKGLVHMWLGDLLREVEKADDINIFMRHYIRPDNLGKHFTKQQLDGEFVSDEDPNE